MSYRDNKYEEVIFKFILKSNLNHFKGYVLI